MAERFSRKGISKVYFVPAIDDLAAPSLTDELDVAVNLTPQVAEVNGFQFENQPIPTPDMNSRFTSQIEGEDQAANSSLTMYELRNGTDTIRAALPKSDTGFILLFAAGLAGSTPAADDECEVWPVTIVGNNREYSAGNEPARYMVGFAISGEPEQEATVAA